MIKIQNEWRIIERNGKKFKQKYWDNLSYEQMNICRDYWIILGGFHINKNKDKWKRKVIEAGLSDYVFEIEILDAKRSGKK